MKGLCLGSLVLASLLVMGRARGQSPPKPGAPAAKLALVIGIDDYAPPLPRLSGCVADARRVERLLTGRFGFAPEDVVRLENEEATVAGIVTAFRRHLIERAGAETEVVFWFSGHGSRVKDESGAAGAEHDGLDSSLVAWDSRRDGRDGSYDLIDDALHSLIAALCERTKRVTLVTDCCHSGGGVRGGGSAPLPHRGMSLGSEAFDAGLLAEFWPDDVEWLEDKESWRELAPEGYAHVAACRSGELAHEIRTEDLEGAPLVHGALTWFLTRELERAQPGVSLRRIADAAAIRLAARFPGQTVIYEGAVERELFGQAFATRPPGFLARVRADGKLLIDAGRLHGIRPGSEFEVQGNMDARPLGRAIVGELGATRCTAAWSGDAPEEAREGAALRAVERSRPGGQEPLPLWSEERELVSELAEAGLARVAQDRAGAYALLRGDGGRVELLDPSGLRIWRADAPDVARARLARGLDVKLRDELRYRALCDLGGTPTTLAIGARFRNPTAAELADIHERYPGQVSGVGLSDTATGARPAGNSRRARGATESPYPLVMLEVTNESGAPLYVAVLSLEENRSRSVLYPTLANPNPGPLAPGARILVPVRVVWPETWSEGRPMRDRYLVVGTPEAQVDFEAYEVRTRGASGSFGSSGAEGVPDILRLAFDGPLTRGGRRRRSTSTDGLAIQVIDLMVEAKD